MHFHVKEIFRSIQGEGIQAGRSAVFCRFAGWNLWTGREQDRASAICSVCDTDFSGTDGQLGGTYDESGLVDAILEAFGTHQPDEIFDDPSLNMMTAPRAGMSWNGMCLMVTAPLPYIVFTGGEPAMQLTGGLIRRLREWRLELAVETNGTFALPSGLDWVTVSPKAGTELVVKTGQELKLLWPQENLDPSQFESLSFENFVLQPIDAGNDAQNAENIRATVAYCMEHPLWRFGMQMHKLAGFY